MRAVPEISLSDAQAALQQGGSLFLDVRDPGSQAKACIPGAHLLTRETFESFLAETPKEAKVIVYCYHGNSSKRVVEMLQEEGFSDCVSMQGGFEGWRERGFPTT